MKEEKKVIPEHVIDIFTKNYQNHPSVVSTRNITKDGLSKIIEKNKMKWVSSYFDGKKHHYKEGVVIYGNNQILMYFNKLEHENIYELSILYSLEENEHLNFLLVGLNKYYTID
jgi:hypothetical protein